MAAPCAETFVEAKSAEGLLDGVRSALDGRFRVAATLVDPVEGPAEALRVRRDA
ncbi:MULTISPECIES: hypothetical protein [unclassified Streptomyces]|uniref:hypothetical protein n=1 Tax=unclassified Streptomyces TaxID=2593676 RepID=UPI001C4F2FD4|nr:hypothetical protein [Streptomyces sp. 13-12-16]